MTQIHQHKSKKKSRKNSVKPTGCSGRWANYWLLFVWADASKIDAMT
jgi:hypothetical protein